MKALKRLTAVNPTAFIILFFYLITAFVFILVHSVFSFEIDHSVFLRFVIGFTYLIISLLTLILILLFG
jgi:hypothetical protein